MNKRALFLLAACVLSLTSFLQAGPSLNNQELFLQANELYKKRDFKSAYTIYGRIEDKSPQVHYNLGNCAFKLDRFGYALLHWRRAERDWGIFDRPELLNNIRHVQGKLGLLEKHKGRGAGESPFAFIILLCKAITSKFTSFVRSAPMLLLQLIFLLVWGFLLLYVRYLYRRHHRLITVVLFACVAASGAMLATKYGDVYRKRGIVISSEGRLYSGPHDGYQHLGTTREGQEGVVKRFATDYYKIKIGGIIGWIHKRHFELL